MKNYIVWGAGKVGSAFLKVCREKDVSNIRVCDSNVLIQGEEVQGYVIESPKTIIPNGDDIIISTDIAYNEIISELDMKYPCHGEVHRISDMIVLHDKERLNIGSLRFVDGDDIKSGVYLSNDFIEKLDRMSFNPIDEYIYGRDNHRKINKWAHYSEIYNRFFSRFRGENVKILEIGVYRGGSLQLWKDYFGDKAEIYGIDIDPKCKEMEEDRIHIFIGSQEDRVFLKSVKDQIGYIDIVIDDGGHMMKQQIVSFEELFDSVKENGIYLCEDCHTSYMKVYGGGLNKEGTFIEYMKGVIDGIHYQYIEGFEDIEKNIRKDIKSINFFDSVVVIEKRDVKDTSISWFC